MKKIFFAIIALFILIPMAFGLSDGEQNGLEELLGEDVHGEILIIAELGAVVVMATILAFVATGLKQPLIPAYIIAGILIGPIGSTLIFQHNIIADQVFVTALSELGITFLLFTVGIELDLSRLKDVGKAAVIIGTGQVAITFVIGYFAAAVLGFSAMSAMYLGLILAFSSTMVVIKILSDRDEIETLHGRIILGILLMQDILVVIVMSVLSSAEEMGAISIEPIANAIITVLGLFAIAIVLSRYVSPKILKPISKSSELVFLFALSMAFIFALMAYSLGFSMAIGGFIGGLSLAVFPYNIEVASKIKPLRDFFAIMFFVSLGMQFTLNIDYGAILIPALVFCGLLLVIKPAVITILSLLSGYEKRTSFLSGVALGQVSEFSLILVLGIPMAIAGGSLAGGDEAYVLPMTLIMAIVTISLTPYLIKYGNAMYMPFSGILSRFERMQKHGEKHRLEHFPDREMKNHVVLFGAHIMGMEIVNKLQQTDTHFVVVDHNPEVIKKLMKRGVHCLYGDIEDVEILEKIKLHDAKIVISTVPDEDDSKFIINRTSDVNPKAIIFVTAKTLENAIDFYREGADYVIHLKLLGGREASEHLGRALKKGGEKRILRNKIHEIKLLEKKKQQELEYIIDPEILKDIDDLKAEEELRMSSDFTEQ